MAGEIALGIIIFIGIAVALTVVGVVVILSSNDNLFR